MIIDRCISCIETEQRHKPETNVFFTSLILLALSPLKTDARAQSIIHNGLQFLLAEKKSQWTWNYVRKKHTKNPPYPDDFDDTCSALAALSIYAPSLVSGDVLAQTVQNLISYETKTGGPYTTWMVPGSSTHTSVWHDVDVVVNSTIAFFLHIHNVQLPHITEFIESSIHKKTYPSRYYTHPVVCLYFISRVYKGKFVKEAIQQILDTRNARGVWENPLITALAVSALIRFGVPHKKVKNAVHVLSTCSEFEAYPLYIEKKEYGKDPTYIGSKAITAAYIAEACLLYQTTHQSVIQKPQQKTEENIHADIIARLKRHIYKISPECVPQLEDVLKRILKSDKGREITLFPYHFYHSLSKHKKPISQDTLIDLGYANLCGWIAYRIYDDILDEEPSSQTADSVSLANMCMREVSAVYLRILPPKEHTCFSDILNNIDAANQWERTHCLIKKETPTNTIPDYKHHHVLAHKSLGHVLGPVTIMILQGNPSDSQKTQAVIKSLSHYLIARQMNDDAHDWLTDLSRGFFNSANSRLWKTASAYRPEIHTEKAGQHRLQKRYWHTIIPQIATDITRHCAHARTYSKKIPEFKESGYINTLLAPLETSTQKALRERETILRFLKKYR